MIFENMVRVRTGYKLTHTLWRNVGRLTYDSLYAGSWEYFGDSHLLRYSTDSTFVRPSSINFSSGAAAVSSGDMTGMGASSSLSEWASISRIKSDVSHSNPKLNNISFEFLPFLLILGLFLVKFDHFTRIYLEFDNSSSSSPLIGEKLSRGSRFWSNDGRFEVFWADGVLKTFLICIVPALVWCVFISSLCTKNGSSISSSGSSSELSLDS